MPVRRWLFLAGAIVTEVTGSLALKAAIDAPWLYAVTAVGYTAAFTLLSLALRSGMPLGAAYGIWGAIGVALTAGLSAVLFGELLTPAMLVGIALLIAGVLCIELGSRAGHGVARGAGDRPAGEGR